ncbi:MAG: type IV pilin-like G/H family protein [Waterburya sp.]
MNNVFTAKLLQSLRNKKGNKGFTLIELLVVVIIVGVLAAVALPNLLGQVGKARETEAKNAIGTLNRGQQTFHFDAKTFVTGALVDTDFQDITNPFGVSLISDVYDYATPVGTAATSGAMTATPVDATDDGVRGFAGQVNYATASGTYGMAVCQGTAIGTTPASLTINMTNPQDSTCDGTVIK